jgi:tripartite-type tricarboxylate transporter receptor subunit TctC
VQQLRRSIIVSIAAAMAGILPAAAQDYPTRPINVIIPYPAGGPTDIAARLITPIMAEKLGQTFVLENVSGGGTTIAIGRLARAAPDGHTLLLHNLQISANVTLYPNTPYDTMKDVAPIGFVNRTPLVLVGRNSLPANTLDELVAWMKTTPAKFAYPGPGSTGHLATTLLAQAAGVKVDFIPYRGAAPAMNDIAGGHVDLFIASPQSAIQPVRAKQMKIFGIASRAHSEVFPGVPVLAEKFGPQLEIQFWHALFAPAGTPQPVLDKITAALQAALADPKVLATWKEQGTEAYPKEQQAPAGAKALFASEVERWGKVIRENNIQAPIQ